MKNAFRTTGPLHTVYDMLGEWAQVVSIDQRHHVPRDSKHPQETRLCQPVTARGRIFTCSLWAISSKPNLEDHGT